MVTFFLKLCFYSASSSTVTETVRHPIKFSATFPLIAFTTRQTRRLKGATFTLLEPTHRLGVHTYKHMCAI